MEKINKIVIDGVMGSGKSTFIVKLSKELAINYFECDRLFSKYSKKHENEQALKNELATIIDSGKFMIEGYHTKISKEYQVDYDLLIIMNIKYFICLYRAIKRHYYMYKNKNDYVAKIRLFDPRVIKWVTMSKIKTLKLIKTTEYPLIVIKKDRQVDETIMNLLDKN